MKDRKLLNIELGRLSADAYRTSRPQSGLVLVLDNIRSAHNVGSAFRRSRKLSRPCKPFWNMLSARD